MRKFALLVAIAALTTSVVAAAATITEPTFTAPKPSAIRSVGLSKNIAGDTLTARWVYKTSPLPATDTAIVVWRQKAGTGSWATIVPNVRTRATSIVRVVPVPDPGAFDSIEVCVRVRRIAAQADSPNTCVKTERSTVANPGGVDSLTITSIIVKPESVIVEATVPGTMPTDKNVVQFCAAARLSDDTVILTSASQPVPECPAMFASVSGFTRETARPLSVPDSIVQVQIIGGDPNDALMMEFADGSRSVPFYRLHATIPNAFYYNGEWWLNQQRPVKVTS